MRGGAPTFFRWRSPLSLFLGAHFRVHLLSLFLGGATFSSSFWVEGHFLLFFSFSFFWGRERGERERRGGGGEERGVHFLSFFGRVGTFFFFLVRRGGGEGGGRSTFCVWGGGGGEREHIIVIFIYFLGGSTFISFWV